MAKISVKNLSKVFGFGAKHALKQYKEGKPRKEILNDTGNAVALFDVSLDVQQGEILVVMGLSGSGKSTFVRCLNRLIDPTAGSIHVDGTDITALSTRELRELRQKNFGMVFQDFALLPHRSVLENTVFGLEIMGVAKAVRHKKGMEALALVGLGGWENSFPHQLSGGMRQRVGLARALAIDPPVLLMDEAFSALDPLIRRDMQDALLGLQSELRKTIVFITHDLGVVANVADRVAVLYAGQIVEVGTTEEVFYDPRHPYTWALLSSLPQLAQRDTELFSITGTPPSLYNKIAGDPFAPRNPYCLKIDVVKAPPMFKITETHYAKTWLLDPRAPKIDKPAAIDNIHDKMIKAFNI